MAEVYYQLVQACYRVAVALIMSYFYVVWVSPFLVKRKTAWMCGAFYCVIMLILIYIPIEMTNTFAYGTCMMLTFLVTCLADRGNIGQKFFLAITFFCLRWQSLMVKSCVTNEMYLLFYAMAQRVEDNDLFWFEVYVVQSVIEVLLTFVFMYMAVRLMLWAYGRKRKHMKGSELLILLVPSVSGAFAYEVIQYYSRVYMWDAGKSVYDTYGYHDWLLILYSVVCFVTIFVMTYVFSRWKDEQEQDKQREVFSRQMQDLQSHITEVERLYRDMRNLRHDMGNHLMTLEQLYAQGAYEEAGKYARSLQDGMQDTLLDVASGNPVADVILSGRKKEAEEKGICFRCGFHYPLSNSVNAFDISIILNNALANAIEAAERERAGTMGEIQEPSITVCSYRRKNMYIIEVTNSYRGELTIDETSGLPVTSKDGDGHGFGLASIRHAARKYLGDIEIGKETCAGREMCALRVMLQIMEVESGE